MKILQVVHGFPPKNRAGTEIYTYYLSKELAKKYDVHILYPIYDNVKRVGLNTFEQEDFVIHEIKLPNRKIKKFWNLLFFESTYLNKSIEEIFKKVLEEIKPDIVHFEHLINLSTSLISIAKELYIPTVLTLHDYWFMCPNIQLLRYDYTICNWDKCRCSECWINMQTKNLSRAFERYIYIPQYLTEKVLKVVLNLLNPLEKFEKRNRYLKTLLLEVDKIIAPSRFLRKIFVRYGVPEDKIIYSENGYKLEMFKGFKKKKKKDTDKIIFGFVGGSSKHKGVHILVDAFMKVSEEKAELRIYGVYDPNYVREILQKAKQKSNIKFIGKFEDVKEPYSEIDVLVVPSIWYETGGPLVIREALATKTPVIASKIGCIPELITEGINGLLFKPNNSNDLYDKIMQILENPKLIKKFKANITPPKSIEEQAKEIEEIYKSLIGGRCNGK